MNQREAAVLCLLLALQAGKPLPSAACTGSHRCSENTHCHKLQCGHRMLVQSSSFCRRHLLRLAATQRLHNCEPQIADTTTAAAVVVKCSHNGVLEMKRIGLVIVLSAMVVLTGALPSFAHCGTCDKTIVEVAAANSDFATLVAAVKAAGLVETLSGDGPFTVFAPTDDAFKALPEGALEDLLKPENKDTLVAILKYHVVPGAVKAKQVVELTSAKTVEGSEVAISVEGEEVKVDGAKVIKTDIACSNGVIHVIDAVIMPKQGG